MDDSAAAGRPRTADQITPEQARELADSLRQVQSDLRERSLKFAPLSLAFTNLKFAEAWVFLMFELGAAAGAALKVADILDTMAKEESKV